MMTRIPIMCTVAISFASILGSISSAESATSFPDVLDRPVNVSFFQAPKGLAKQLKMQDAEKYIDFSKFWSPFYASDVWVFFLSNKSELSILPNELKNFIVNLGTEDVESFTRYDLNLGDGRRVQVHLVLMESYIYLNPSEMLCVFSSAILQEIGSYEGEFERVSFPNCVEGRD